MHDSLEHSPASIRVYTRAGLWAYDALVMCVLAKRVWGCPPTRLIEHYREHVTRNHADIGVGTGFCLERCGLEQASSRLALIDLQPNCLAHAARRLAPYRPTCHVRDVLQPLHGIEANPFDSIGLGGVLHCLAGGFEAKAEVFDNLLPLAAPGTKIFGYTLVSDDVGLRARRRVVHALLNRNHRQRGRPSRGIA
jgi:Methyltransferase domain